MYTPYQLLRVHHDERLRYAERRRMITQAATATRASSRQPAPSSRRRHPFWLGRLLSQG